MPENAIKPVVAVTDFANETGFSGQWKLGRGIPDLLVSELLATDRVIVVDRRQLNTVVSKIMRQGRDLFRKENSVEHGQLKNARYLIRGVIADFNQTKSASAWFRSSKAGAGIRGACATVMINLSIIDVETGEILCSIPAEGDAKASSKWVKFDYNNTSFGGEVFFKSPIGKATREAIRQAVFLIIQKIPFDIWKPRIAAALPDYVVVNGGRNVNLNEGDIFDVREESHPVTDPNTGNVIGRTPGKIIGRIRIISINETTSDGVVLSGEAGRGHYLERRHVSRLKKKSE